MEIYTITENDRKIAVIHNDGILIRDVQSALDFIATVGYETGCERVILDKEVLCADFFDLRTGLAGEILQKFMNYQMKVAIVGDFSLYKSKNLHAFMIESNRGNGVFFLPSEKEAREKLSAV